MPRLRLVSSRTPVRCRHCDAALFDVPLVTPAQLDAVEEHMRRAHPKELAASRDGSPAHLLQHVTIRAEKAAGGAP